MRTLNVTYTIVDTGIALAVDKRRAAISNRIADKRAREERARFRMNYE